MSRVNMPEKKDAMGQGMQIFQMGKSIYDMSQGNPSTAAGQAADAATQPKAEIKGAAVQKSSSDAWQRRVARTA